MSEVTGYYYLHTNGDLIFKRFEPEDDSDFVRRVWPVITSSRACAWTICIEALALGAREERVRELQEKWKLTDEDAETFAERTNMRIVRDGDQWCATFADFTDLQESQAGFGDDALHAFADLAKQGTGLNSRGSRSELLRQVNP